ncbi:MAG: deoxyguanosinetriphosphate triphosphohydrolase [Candidatus Omnitrophica bacterium]|nr:deoxyguanosinetriphosphate triphosphohydrolase [Candidatus Omnitrophota bacterium]
MKKLKNTGNTPDGLLASFATKSSNSRGRKHPEKEHPYRTIYQRDRDRIIHSQAFRKLEYKTQVFITHEGDYYRTRLTHTLEVAQIARTIGKSLGLNEDLIEAIALAHDLGHTPFGHAGEEILNKLLDKEGGFNHNIQGLRVVDFLEIRYPDFQGLNLTWEVREGIAKHSTTYDLKADLQHFSDLDLDKQPTLETQVVDIADEIAYDNHDLDDGLTSGLIQEKDLEKIEIWKIATEKIKKQYRHIDQDMLKFLAIRNLINFKVTDLIEHSKHKLSSLNINSWKKVKSQETRLVAFSPYVSRLRKPFRKFLYDNLYCSRRVLRMTEKSKRFIQELFENYCKNPWQIPKNLLKQKIKKESLKRTVADYIAGMTDRFALDEYKKLFDPYEKV